MTQKKPLILIVDDDLDPMHYYLEEFEARGCRVEQRQTVGDAVAYLKAFAHLLDGVVLDWMLPLGDYADDTGEFTEIDGGKIILDHLVSDHPGLPVIVFTNRTFRGATMKGASALFLQKFDHDPRLFCQTVAQHFGVKLTR